MNFEKIVHDDNEDAIKKDSPEAEAFSKNIAEKRKSISPLSKYALIALVGYLGGKGIEKQIDITGELIDKLKPENSLVETVDESFYSDEFGSFKLDFPEDKSYEDALLLVEEVLSKDDSELSHEKIQKLQLVRDALSESLEILDDVLFDVDNK